MFYWGLGSYTLPAGVFASGSLACTSLSWLQAPPKVCHMMSYRIKSCHHVCTFAVAAVVHMFVLFCIQQGREMSV